MRRLTRKDSQENTRERLLAAARREIVAHGVEAATVRSIAEAAGFTMGAFYSNFASKDAMLLELAKRHLDDKVRQLHDIVATPSDGERDEIIENIAHWLRALLQNKKLSAMEVEFNLYARRNASFREGFLQGHRERLAALSDDIRILYERKGLRPTFEPLQLATGFAALWNGFALQGAVADIESPDRIVLAFLRALLDSSAPIGVATPCARTASRQSP
ncbi:MAG: TetR/AcrR family transcriptional regulator [Desulfovibrionaceae bacterium]|jgi:AcrR family transcriptional regulator|nr:TetR/AcrR family transcriptional regulator [Desulfovibrionaceae bacterium]